MSYILAIVMSTLAIAGMWLHADWRYFMSAWAICALFIFTGHVGRIIHMIEEDKRREAERRIQYIRDNFKKKGDTD